MYQFAVHLGTINYMLSFVNAKSLEIVVNKFLAAKTSEPNEEIHMADDYQQRIGFKPVDVKAWITIDKEREQELMTQNRLHEIRTNLKIDQRIAGDSEIQTAAASQAARQGKLANRIQQPGSA